jgi:membrane protease subunit HflC
MRKHLFTIVVAVVIAVVLLLYLFSFTVRANEKAVRTTWNDPRLSIDDPGLYWKWPFPVQKVYRFDAGLRIFEGDHMETTTMDKRTIVVVTCIGWKIAEPLTYLKAVGTEEEAESRLNSLLKEGQNTVIARHSLSELVSTEREELKFDEIEQEMLQMVAATTLEEYGIQVDLLKIKRLMLPQAVLESVFKRMSSERFIEAAQKRAEGESQANTITSEAISKAESMVAEAEADAKRIMGEGDAASAEYYQVFKQHPELASFLKELEVLKTSLQKRATVILSTGSVPFELLEGRPDLLKKTTVVEEAKK